MVGAYLVALAFSTNNVLSRDFEIVKIEGACRGCTNAELLFLFGDLDAHVLGSHETCYALVSFTRVDLSK